MTNTTDTYWDVNGTSLQTFAWNITTLGGDRLGVPPLRGSDLVIPHRRGQMWLPKQADSRTITLGMWVVGAESDGSAPTSASRRQKFMDNWRQLRSLLHTPEQQITLTKRFYVGGSLITASAQAQVMVDPPTMNGPAGAAFTADFVLADPYFYGAQVTQTLASGANTITVAGDDVTEAIKFHIADNCTNITFTNNTLNISLRYAGTLISGDVVDIDVAAYTSTTDPASTPAYDSSGTIQHSGHSAWMRLSPGDNSLTVSNKGSSTVQLQYQPVWW